MLGWLRRSRAGKVLLVVAVLAAGVCAARLMLGPPGPDSRASTTLPPHEPGTAAPMDVADAFAHAWVARGPAEQWYGRLLPHATADLATELDGTDPQRIPHTRITGAGQPVAHSDATLDVAYPAEGGTLRLRLIAPHGTWLVDEVDWQPG